MEANGSTRMVDMTSAYARLEQAREASRNRNRSSPTDTVVPHSGAQNRRFGRLYGKENVSFSLAAVVG